MGARRRVLRAAHGVRYTFISATHADRSMKTTTNVGAVEAFLALLAEVRAAGSWKRYANEPRVQLVVLRKLTERGRAKVPRYHRILTHLFARRTLPDVLFWKILEFWRTDRDP